MDALGKMERHGEHGEPWEGWRTLGRLEPGIARSVFVPAFPWTVRQFPNGKGDG